MPGASRLPSAPALLLLGLCLGCVLWTSYEREWNFDCVGYAGAARALLGESPTELQAHVYEDLALAAPPYARHDIADGSGYRSKLSHDAETFAVQLPLYRNKPLYIVLVAAATGLGANSIRACFWISSAALALLAYLMVDTLSRSVSTPRAWAVSVALISLPAIRRTGAIATPDALCGALAFAGLRSVVLRKQRQSIFFGLLSILARPDIVPFSLGVIAWPMARRPKAHVQLAAWVTLATVVAYCEMTLLGYSWSAVFTHTFVHRLKTLQQFGSAGLTTAEYFHTLRRGLRGGFVTHPSTWWVFMAISVLGLAMVRGRYRRRFGLALILIWVSIGIHVGGFPMLADRFFLAQYVSIAVLATMCVSRAMTLDSTDGGSGAQVS